MLNSDFELGRRLRELQIGRPGLGFSRCLVAFANNETEINMAFDHLSLENLFPPCLGIFGVFGDTLKLGVSALLDTHLSALLASRIKDILYAYSSAIGSVCAASLTEQLKHPLESKVSRIWKRFPQVNRAALQMTSCSFFNRLFSRRIPLF